MHSAHSSVRSGMWSPLRASLSLSATTVSPGGRRIQARGTSTWRAGSRDKYSYQVCSRACMRLFTGPIRSVSGESISAVFTAAVDSLIGRNENNCHIPPTHFFCVGRFSHLRDFCPRTPAFFIGVFYEFNCFPPNLAFSIGKKQDNCLFPPTEISAIVGGKPGNEKTCLHFFEAWA